MSIGSFRTTRTPSAPSGTSLASLRWPPEELTPPARPALAPSADHGRTVKPPQSRAVPGSPSF